MELEFTGLTIERIGEILRAALGGEIRPTSAYEYKVCSIGLGDFANELDYAYLNSLHHQAVHRLGDGLIASARDADGFVQAIENPSASFVIGVQWYPEYLFYRRAQRRLFRALVQTATIARAIGKPAIQPSHDKKPAP